MGGGERRTARAHKRPLNLARIWPVFRNTGQIPLGIDKATLNWLVDRDQPGRDLEQLCDLIAAGLLLPKALVTQVLKHRAPEAAHIRALYDASAASEVVCAITLAQRLPSQGAVVMMDISSSTVSHASVASPEDDGRPLVYPWPRQPILANHRLARLGRGPGSTRAVLVCSPMEEYGRTITSTRSRAVAASTPCSPPGTCGQKTQFHTDTTELVLASAGVLLRAAD